MTARQRPGASAFSEAGAGVHLGAFSGPRTLRTWNGSVRERPDRRPAEILMSDLNVLAPARRLSTAVLRVRLRLVRTRSMHHVQAEAWSCIRDGVVGSSSPTRPDRSRRR